VLGKAGPVIVIWEDLNWAEATLLDLIDDVASWLSGVPVLLLCAARLELLESRPTWGGGKPSAPALELAPCEPPPAVCATTSAIATARLGLRRVRLSGQGRGAGVSRGEPGR
jgi:hypothetical protein